MHNRVHSRNVYTSLSLVQTTLFEDDLVQQFDNFLNLFFNFLLVEFSYLLSFSFTFSFFILGGRSCRTTPLLDRPSADPPVALLPSAGPPKMSLLFPSHVTNFVLSSLSLGSFRGVAAAVSGHGPPKVRASASLASSALRSRSPEGRA